MNPFDNNVFFSLKKQYFFALIITGVFYFFIGELLYASILLVFIIILGFIYSKVNCNPRIIFNISRFSELDTSCCILWFLFLICSKLIIVILVKYSAYNSTEKIIILFALNLSLIANYFSMVPVKPKNQI